MIRAGASRGDAEQRLQGGGGLVFGGPIEEGGDIAIRAQQHKRLAVAEQVLERILMVLKYGAARQRWQSLEVRRQDQDALGLQVIPKTVAQFIKTLASRVAILNQGKAGTDARVQQLGVALGMFVEWRDRKPTISL